MEYDFKSLHPEYGSGAPMWGRLAEFGAPSPEEIDFGVAEMKFRLAPEIAAALERHVTAGTFGYSGAPESLKREICAWMARRHGWRIEPEWLFQTYGLVLAVGCCVRALTEPGDGILLNYPSYPPFYRAIEQNGRRLVRSDLLELEGRYVFDFEDMERKIAQENVKLYILCSPQNPTGRVWTRTELERVGEMCLRHGVKVVSDEIHFDICYPGHEHSVFASLSDEFAANSVVLTAPSKTFNIAGMTISNVIIPSTLLRERVKETVSRDMGGYFNSFGYAACEAAYKSAEPWLDECLKVLEGNCRLFTDFLRERVPAFSCHMPEGTYLAWMDGRRTGLGSEELTRFLHGEARFYTEPGEVFGSGYELFQRVNLACPREYVEKALLRLEAAAKARGLI